MAEVKIVVGRIGDSLTSADKSVTDEAFVCVYAVPIKLAHSHLVSGTVVVDDGVETEYTEDVDYTINYLNGTITVIDREEEGMQENETYYIDYDWNVPNLATKINAVTTAASTVHYLCTTRAGRNGVATIIYTPAE